MRQNRKRLIPRFDASGLITVHEFEAAVQMGAKRYSLILGLTQNRLSVVALPCATLGSAPTRLARTILLKS
jgi:hypothetical protein